MVVCKFRAELLESSYYEFESSKYIETLLIQLIHALFSIVIMLNDEKLHTIQLVESLYYYRKCIVSSLYEQLIMIMLMTSRPSTVLT